MAETIVYVDGLNLYYGALRKTVYRWLDIAAMCDLLLPKNTVELVRYFTAKVADLPNSSGAQVRQQRMWQALETSPRLRRHEGQFKVRHDFRPPSRRIRDQRPEPKLIKVQLPEEKGSDVNLASWLLLDAFNDDFGRAVVISNDSDLAEPIRIAREELGKVVGVVNPTKHDPVLFGDFHPDLRKWMLAQSQFPNVVHLPDGSTVERPPEW